MAASVWRLIFEIRFLIFGVYVEMHGKHVDHGIAIIPDISFCDYFVDLVMVFGLTDRRFRDGILRFRVIYHRANDHDTVDHGSGQRHQVDAVLYAKKNRGARGNFEGPTM